MKLAVLLLGFIAPFAAAAQNPIPAGTILPVRLDKTIDAGKIHAGETIRARVMQNVPGTPIRRGAEVEGRVVSATTSRVRIRFEAVDSHGRQIPLRANLRAVASMLEVSQAYIPENAPARGMTPENWNTQQIGGDQVYRGGGPVTSGGSPVGVPTPYGVRVRLIANGSCRGAVDGNEQPQALWVFSSDACGVYGIPGLRIAHAGRSSGMTDLVSEKGPVKIRSGSGWLLRVQGLRSVRESGDVR